MRGDQTGSYLIKDFILGSVDAFTQGLDPGVLLLRSLGLKLDVLDLWEGHLNSTCCCSVRGRPLACVICYSAAGINFSCNLIDHLDNCMSAGGKKISSLVIIPLTDCFIFNKTTVEQDVGKPGQSEFCRNRR